MDYLPTVGLEIHAELKTQTKMFCNSKNDPDEKRPNVNVCPVCMGHPGTLPVINREALKHVLRVGAAVGGTIADYTEFDRKNYFYPDIPKGYQISQYRHPLVSGGSINGIALTRVHLEEDTARSIHAPDEGHSLVDFNRAGVPLMELVTEPVMHSGEEAVAFAKELQLLLRYLDVADADMEKGQMRVEANISISPRLRGQAKSQVTSQKLGTKVEIKNLNSFRSVEHAIAYEVDRQTTALEGGDAVVQETRGWDEVKQETFSQRRKEYSHDYRYFPDPDLPQLLLSEILEFRAGELKRTLPELPWERRARYLSLGLKKEDADMFTTSSEYGTFFDTVAKTLANDTKRVLLATNYITADLAGLIKGAADVTALSPGDFAELIGMIADDTVSSRGAKDILKTMVETGGTPKEIALREGLLQQSDEGTLRAVVDRLIAAHPDVVRGYKTGKTNALQFLIGAAMRETKGAGNPQVLRKIFEDTLK